MTCRHHYEEGTEPLKTDCGMTISALLYDVWVSNWEDVNCPACWEVRNRESKVFKDLQDGEGFPPKPLTTVPTPQAERVAMLMTNWFNEFERKSADYQTSTGNVSENFGLMGQFMKLTDKIHKLRKPMWDQEIRKQVFPDDPAAVAEFNFEGTEEILRDLIGHAFLALDFLEQNKPKG